MGPKKARFCTDGGRLFIDAAAIRNEKPSRDPEEAGRNRLLRNATRPSEIDHLFPAHVGLTVLSPVSASATFLGASPSQSQPRQHQVLGGLGGLAPGMLAGVGGGGGGGVPVSRAGGTGVAFGDGGAGEGAPVDEDGGGAMVGTGTASTVGSP